MHSNVIIVIGSIVNMMGGGYMLKMEVCSSNTLFCVCLKKPVLSLLDIKGLTNTIIFTVVMNKIFI